MTSKLTITREQATDKEIQMLIDSHENGTAMFLRVDAYYLMAKELQERRKAEQDSEPVILYRQRNPANGMKTDWMELHPEEFKLLKQYSDENAEFMTLYRHAQPAPVVPNGLRLALSNAGIAAPESDEMLAATCEKHIQALVTWVKDRKPFQSAPVVPSFEEWLSAANRKPLGWVKDAMREAYDACRAAMLQAGISAVIPDCWCRTCRPVTMGDMRFVVCPDCGNKRCPRANDHRNACSGSNEPGQEGSAYPAAPQEVKGE